MELMLPEMRGISETSSIASSRPGMVRVEDSEISTAGSTRTLATGCAGFPAGLSAAAALSVSSPAIPRMAALQ